MRFFKALVTVSVLLVILSSCDKVPTISYIVKNDTGSPITVVREMESNYINKKPIDTFRIAAGKDTVIAVRTDAVTGALHYKTEKIMEDGDTIRQIKALRMYKNDSIRSSRYFLRTDRWAFSKSADFWGTYTLMVSNTDFW